MLSPDELFQRFVSVVVLRLPVSVPELGRSGILAPTCLLGEPRVFPRGKSGHQLHELGHGSWLIVSEVPDKEFIINAMFERNDCLGIVTLDDLLFCLKNRVQ